MEAVIFDIGGVLAYDVWEPLLNRDHGVRAIYPSLDKDKLQRIGEKLWHAFAYVSETPHGDWQDLERWYWSLFIGHFNKQLEDANPDDFIRMTNKFIRRVYGMTQLLQDLRGVRLAICSNNNEFWFRRQWDKLKLDRFFDPNKVTLSCRIGASKSSEGFEMFDAAIGTLGIPKAQCVFVDDKESNIKKAKEFGISGIHFRGAKRLRASLQGFGLLTNPS